MRTSFQLLALGGLALSQPVLADADDRRQKYVDDRKDLLGESDYDPISALFYSDYACKTVALNITGNNARVAASEIFFTHLAKNASGSAQADRVSSWVYPLRDGGDVDAIRVSNVSKLFFSRDGGYPSVTATPPFAAKPGVCAPYSSTFDMSVDDVFINSYKFLYV
jgi:hypothetical protein